MQNAICSKIWLQSDRIVCTGLNHNPNPKPDLKPSCSPNHNCVSLREWGLEQFSLEHMKSLLPKGAISSFYQS